MSAHDHTELTHGCYRCALNVDEERDGIETQFRAALVGVSALIDWRELLQRYGELAVWCHEETLRNERNATSDDPTREPVG